MLSLRRLHLPLLPYVNCHPLKLKPETPRQTPKASHSAPGPPIPAQLREQRKSSKTLHVCTCLSYMYIQVTSLHVSDALRPCPLGPSAKHWGIYLTSDRPSDRSFICPSADINETRRDKTPSTIVAQGTNSTAPTPQIEGGGRVHTLFVIIAAVYIHTTIPLLTNPHLSSQPMG